MCTWNVSRAPPPPFQISKYATGRRSGIRTDTYACDFFYWHCDICRKLSDVYNRAPTRSCQHLVTQHSHIAAINTNVLSTIWHTYTEKLREHVVRTGHVTCRDVSRQMLTLTSQRPTPLSPVRHGLWPAARARTVFKLAPSSPLALLR